LAQAIIKWESLSLSKWLLFGRYFDRPLLIASAY